MLVLLSESARITFDYNNFCSWERGVDRGDDQGTPVFVPGTAAQQPRSHPWVSCQSWRVNTISTHTSWRCNNVCERLPTMYVNAQQCMWKIAHCLCHQDIYYNTKSLYCLLDNWQHCEPIFFFMGYITPCKSYFLVLVCIFPWVCGLQVLVYVHVQWSFIVVEKSLSRNILCIIGTLAG